MATAPSVRWLWLTLAVVAADRTTKYAIERSTDEGFRHDLVPNLATLVHSVNPGVAFGMLSNSASSWISVMLIGSSIAVVILLGWLLTTGRAGDSASQAGLALVAGGATGNMLDRLLHGGVTDFLELHVGSFRWPAFNVADSAITVGALMVIYELLRGSRHAAKERV